LPRDPSQADLGLVAFDGHIHGHEEFSSGVGYLRGADLGKLVLLDRAIGGTQDSFSAAGRAVGPASKILVFLAVSENASMGGNSGVRAGRMVIRGIIVSAIASRSDDQN
jgi:hypothetical protein